MHKTNENYLELMTLKCMALEILENKQPLNIVCIKWGLILK